MKQVFKTLSFIETFQSNFFEKSVNTLLEYMLSILNIESKITSQNAWQLNILFKSLCLTCTNDPFNPETILSVHVREQHVTVMSSEWDCSEQQN